MFKALVILALCAAVLAYPEERQVRENAYLSRMTRQMPNPMDMANGMKDTMLGFGQGAADMMQRGLDGMKAGMGQVAGSMQGRRRREPQGAPPPRPRPGGPQPSPGQPQAIF